MSKIALKNWNVEENQHYVYQHIYPDDHHSNPGQIFNIGKGHKGRAWEYKRPSETHLENWEIRPVYLKNCCVCQREFCTPWPNKKTTCDVSCLATKNNNKKGIPNKIKKVLKLEGRNNPEIVKSLNIPIVDKTTLTPNIALGEPLPNG